MKVELLYFDGCPNHEMVLIELRRLLAPGGAPVELEPRRIESAEEAERERFLGSPTMRVDGTDVEPGAAARTDFGLKCRLYRTPEGLRGTPPEAWIAAALRPAAAPGRRSRSTRGGDR